MQILHIRITHNFSLRNTKVYAYKRNQKCVRNFTKIDILKLFLLMLHSLKKFQETITITTTTTQNNSNNNQVNFMKN